MNRILKEFGVEIYCKVTNNILSPNKKISFLRAATFWPDVISPALNRYRFPSMVWDNDSPRGLFLRATHKVVQKGDRWSGRATRGKPEATLHSFVTLLCKHTRTTFLDVTCINNAEIFTQAGGENSSWVVTLLQYTHRQRASEHHGYWWGEWGQYRIRPWAANHSHDRADQSRAPATVEPPNSLPVATSSIYFTHTTEPKSIFFAFSNLIQTF